MKKLLFSIVLLLSINTIVNAQAWDGRGDTKINAGYEFYSYYPLNSIDDTRNGLSASIDYGITDNISVGSGINYNIKYTNFYFNIRSDYHFQNLFELSSNFDVYAGGDIGLNSYYKNNFDFGFHVGTRFMFTDAVGIYLEIGNRGNVGLSYNF